MIRLIPTLFLCALLSGCFEDSTGIAQAGAATELDEGSASVTTQGKYRRSKRDATTQTGNRTPTISGTPVTSVAANQLYRFVPAAADADGNPLTFSIANRPSWATFNSSTGELSGTPTTAQSATYGNIGISVSDGLASASLSAFAITVTPTGNVGAATVSWSAPTLNNDGSPLTDLAGYRIYYGTSASSLTQVINVATVGITTYVIGDLGSGTWYFGLRALNSTGVESDLSNVASKTI